MMIPSDLCKRLLHKFSVLYPHGLCATSCCTKSRFGFFPPESLLASTSSQSLYLPSGHANILRIFPTCRRHCWRRLPRRAFVFRRGTPTCSGFSRPAGGIVGVDIPAKPLSSVGPRQHAQVFLGSPETSVGRGPP